MMKMKRILMLVLAVLMLCLSGCVSKEKREQQVHDQLRGTWVTSIACSDQTALDLLDNIDFEQQEIDLLTASGPRLVKIAYFNDGEYRFEIDTDAVWENVRGFYVEIFDSLYEKREGVNSLYNKEFQNMSKEEFLTFYAELYGYISADKMLDGLANLAFDYEAMHVIETGKYTVESDKLIYCQPNESTASAGTLRFSVGGDALNIAFANGDEVYKRVVE